MFRSLSFFLILVLLISCKTEKPLEAQLEYQITAKLGEGAIWDYRTKTFYWVDIEEKLLHMYSSDNKINKSIKLPSRIGTVVPTDKKNKAIIALEDGIYIINTSSQELSLLSDVEADIKENRFNDGKCDPNGNLWVGSMNLTNPQPNAGLYKVNGTGETKKMLHNISISNGIVWTKDKKTMYYIDTPTRQIKAFDFDSSNSTISNERIAVEINEKDGFPDGMTIDENDMLWVGMWDGNAVAHYNPISGELLTKIQVPAHNVTSCAFGGENLDELFITTASIDMTSEEKKQYPLAGSVFKIKLDVKGVKSSFFNTPKVSVVQAN